MTYDLLLIFTSLCHLQGQHRSLHIFQLTYLPKYTNPTQALTLLNLAVAKDPKFANVYSNRGNAYRDLKQYPNAIKDYTMAIIALPNREAIFDESSVVAQG